MVEFRAPSIEEALPPVTRLMILDTEFGPENVADSLLPILKKLKL
jgi:hypothetical protein